MRYGVFSEYTTSPEIGIILPNHLASGLEDTAGDRAEYLNRATGLTVVAFERPGTASLPACEAFCVESYLEDAGSRAQELRGIIDKEDLQRAVVTHDSAGALDSLALAVSGQIEVERVIAIEPVGLMNVSNTYKGLARWAKPGLAGDKGRHLDEFKNLKHLEPIRSKPSKSELIARFKKEVRVYRNVYTSPIAISWLRQLAERCVKVDLIMAEHSYTSTPEVQTETVREFGGSSVKVDILPDAHHACVEPYSHLIHLVSKALGRLPSKPEEA